MKKRIVMIADYVIERAITPIRPVWFFFYVLHKAYILGRNLMYLLVNEYTKGKLSKCGSGVRLHGKITITTPETVSFGDNVHINDNAFFRTEGGLEIHDNAHISRNLLIYTVNHRYEGVALPYDHVFEPKKVVIRENVWIGMNVTIVPGVTIGEGAIIGMGAVVTKDVGPLCIVGGNPAKVIKKRDEDHYNKLKAQKQFSGMSGFTKSS